MSGKKMCACGSCETEAHDCCDPQAHLSAVPTPEEQATVFALSYDEAVAALEAEDPAAVAVATVLILKYSEQAGELMKQGEDYLPSLIPTEMSSPIEVIAMEVVQEAIEEEMETAS